MRSIFKAAFCAAFGVMVCAGVLQAADNRITAPINSARRTILYGHMRPEAIPQNDDGPVAPDLAVGYATVFMKLDPSIDGFLAEQQTPGSPSFRQWLTPEQFGNRFGTGPNDLAKVVAWLKSQGLQVNDVARGRHWITFSGKASDMSRALGTQFHYFRSSAQPGGLHHFANASEPSIPAALAPVIAGFRGLDDFPSHSMLRKAPVQPADSSGRRGADYNSAAGNHFLAPDDLATIFNIKALYDAGIDGTGQTLVIAGETDLIMSDFVKFQVRFGLPANTPQLMLFGNDPGIRGDLIEADLDLEWSTAVARNATIVYAYSTSVYTAAQYAVDNKLGQQMSISYGDCEPYGSLAFRAVAQQANAEGMTLFISSGDSAAATCDRNGPLPQASHGARASWPSSFPEVTSVGGTEFDDSGGNYWAATNSPSGASALSYIPEVPWNDTAAANDLEGGGGAPSVLFPKPFWQQGPGVPNDGMRDTPDISLPASPFKYAYLIESDSVLQAVGGTSGSSPSWAGIAALLNQYLVSKGILSQPGLGNINPALYRLAQSTKDVFHDIVNGDNKVPCKFDSPDCVDGMLGFAATPGYDSATGLGSVDVFKFVNEFAGGTASTTALSSSATSAAISDTVMLTATVQGGGVTPTGTVDFVTSDIVLGSAALTPGVKGTATASLSISGNMAIAGNGSLSALYSGDGVYSGSAGTAMVNATIPAGTTGSYVVAWASPNPPPMEGLGEWHVIIGLTEKNGIATTLTNFNVDGKNVNLNSFFASTAIPAMGTLTTGVVYSRLKPGDASIIILSGMDADGTPWTQQVTVTFGDVASSAAVALNPGITLSVTNPPPAAVVDPSCAAPLTLMVQETGGYMTFLSKLTQNGTAITPQISSILGSTRLAPYGTLQGTICYDQTAAPGVRTFVLTGTLLDGQIGGTVTATGTGTISFQPPASPLSVSPASVPLVTDSKTTGASATIAITNSSQVWTATIFPANRSTRWLTLANSSGTGPLTVQASNNGLPAGVYGASVLITSAGLTARVPVTMTVSGSPAVTITTVANNFSGNTIVAPGTMVYVKGTNLAPDTSSIIASTLPLPYQMHGVSAFVNEVSAPMYYVSSTQLDVQIPYEVGIGPATLWINNNGKIASFPIQVASTAPGLFTIPLDALTGQVVSSVTPGEFLELFSTGEGDVTPSLATGATPFPQSNPAHYPAARQALSVTIGGVAASVPFAGIPNGILAEMQINIQVDPSTPTGMQPLVLTVGGVQSPPVMVMVNPAPQQ